MRRIRVPRISRLASDIHHIFLRRFDLHWLKQRQQVDTFMPTADLMAKLLEIELQANQKGDKPSGAMALAAPGDLLKVERAMVKLLADNENLRRPMERCEDLKIRKWAQIVAESDGTPDRITRQLRKQPCSTSSCGWSECTFLWSGCVAQLRRLTQDWCECGINLAECTFEAVPGSRW